MGSRLVGRISIGARTIGGHRNGFECCFADGHRSEHGLVAHLGNPHERAFHVGDAGEPVEEERVETLVAEQPRGISVLGTVLVERCLRR